MFKPPHSRISVFEPTDFSLNLDLTLRLYLSLAKKSRQIKVLENVLGASCVT